VSSRSLKLLSIVAAVLVAVLVIVEVADDSMTPASNDLLFADLRKSVDHIDRIQIAKADYATPVTIVRKDDKWTILERNHYPANMSKVREILLALVNARVIETKTANPENHHRLGLREPSAEGSTGTGFTVSGPDLSYGVIFGNVAQGDFRYLRKSDADQAFLIDQNPAIPPQAGGWLLAGIVDVDNAEVAAVTITHPGGDIIRIDRESDAATNYVVTDIPEGRELSYPTVANGIVGALNDLTMEDVRASQDRNDPVETVFATTDGLLVTAWSDASGDEIWVSFAAEARDDADEETRKSADEINNRVGGWQYRISDYKLNLLTRQWHDILKNPPDAE
jgi:hypothetical protein